MIQMYLGLGSNVGDDRESGGRSRRDNLEKALVELEKRGVRVMRRSKVYETEPVGYKDQAWFLNMVVECEVDEKRLEGAAPALLAEYAVKMFQEVERAVGRVPTFKLGPRVIDIDLLLLGHDGEVCVTSHMGQNVVVPHAHLHERRFVLEPLAELVPGMRHPVLGKTVSELLKECGDIAIVRPLS